MIPPDDTSPPPRAIITVGLPACGKSTYAATLAPGYAELNMDDLRFEVSGDATNQAVTHRAFGRRQQRLRELAEAGRDVILSDTHAKRRDRRRAVKDLQALGYHVTIVFFDVGERTCHARNDRRARQVPPAVIMRMAQRLRDTPPTPDEADAFVALRDADDPLLV